MKYKFLKKYKDKWGEIWVRSPRKEFVIRISDDMIGGWFDGRGLIEV